MKNWLDKYDDTPKAQNGIEGTMGGLTDVGFNYNGAWGGTMQLGGSLPGATGNIYARIGAPSNGPYAKKTKASAQKGIAVSDNTRLKPIVTDKPINRETVKSTDKKSYKMSPQEALMNKLKGKNLKESQETLDKIAEKITAVGSLSPNPYISIPSGIVNFTLGVAGAPTPGDAGLDYMGAVGSAATPESAKNFKKVARRVPFFKGLSFVDAASDIFEFTASEDLSKKQNGGEIKYYQEGLDWTPKNISRDGSEIPQAQLGTHMLPIDPSKAAENFFELLSVPQKAITSLFSGKYQTPSEAMNIKNPVGAFLTDAVLDPTNLVGAGVVGKATKAAGKAAKVERALAKPSVASSTKKVVNTAKNLEDLQSAKKFAQQYGYELPQNLERIAQSDKLTDRTVRGMMDRHNTFVRGVSTNWDEIEKINPEILRHLEGKGIDWKNNPKAAAEYMATHIPINTGYGRASLSKDVFDQGLEGLYTSNSIPTAEGYTYGKGFITKVKKPTDFSSANRQDWITRNNPEYYEHYLPKTITNAELKYLQDWSSSNPYDFWNASRLGSEMNVRKVHSWLDDVGKKDLELRKKYGLGDKEKGDYYMGDDIKVDHPNYEKLRKEKTQSVNEYRKELKDYYNKTQDEVWKTLTPTKEVTFDKSLLKTEHYKRDPEDYLLKKVKAPEEYVKHDRVFSDINTKLKNKYKAEKDNILKVQDEVYEEGEKKGWSKELENKFNLLNNDLKSINVKQNLEAVSLKENYLDKNFDNWRSEYETIGDKYAHYIHIGTPGEKILEPIKSWEITPDIWKNKSRAHTNTYSKKLSALDEGGVIKDDMGQWAHPGEITEIDSPYITMEGVPYPVLGISDTGDTQMMYPEEDYEFDGESVTEYPMMRNGGVNSADAQPLKKLDQLLNFTNYNKSSKGGWLDKYN